MRSSEELKAIAEAVRHLEDQSITRLCRINRLDRAMCAIRLALAGCNSLSQDELSERITDVLVVSGNPHDVDMWPKYLQPKD